MWRPIVRHQICQWNGVWTLTDLMCLASARACDCAVNNPSQVNASWSCTYPVYGCADIRATNYVAARAAVSGFVSVPAMCQFAGCDDAEAINFDTTVGRLFGCLLFCCCLLQLRVYLS